MDSIQATSSTNDITHFVTQLRSPSFPDERKQKWLTEILLLLLLALI